MEKTEALKKMVEFYATLEKKDALKKMVELYATYIKPIYKDGREIVEIDEDTVVLDINNSGVLESISLSYCGIEPDIMMTEDLYQNIIFDFWPYPNKPEGKDHLFKYFFILAQMKEAGEKVFITIEGDGSVAYTLDEALSRISEMIIE